MLEKLSQQLATGVALASEQVQQAVEELIDEKVSPATKADFLSHLAQKGETPAEIAIFAAALREKSIQPPVPPDLRHAREILDVVGTGGDHLGTFNISTTVAILCSAAGVAVAKHGNRAVTSRVGSADVLETLGIRVDLSPEAAVHSLCEHNFAFFFAPRYHPAFKNIAPARKICAARGQRTVFNFLGPLLNPARPSAQLVGVPRPELCEPIAHVLQTLGVRRAIVVSGKVTEAGTTDRFLDEFSTLGDSTVAEFYQERGFSTSLLSLEQFPLQPGTLSDLAGGDRQVNADIIRRVLRAEECGPKRDAVLLNTAAALFVAGAAKSLAEGWDVAAEVIDSGRAAAKLEELTTL